MELFIAISICDLLAARFAHSEADLCTSKYISLRMNPHLSSSEICNFRDFVVLDWFIFASGI